MKRINRRHAIKLPAAGLGALALPPGELVSQEAPQPFGPEFPQLDSLTTGPWWTKAAIQAGKPRTGGQPPSMDVPRAEVVAFAVYTHHDKILKLTAQLFPLKPGEPRVARLEFQRDGQWTEAAQAEVLYPGWDAHYRIEDWDNSQSVPYRVRHGELAQFEGLIRRPSGQRRNCRRQHVMQLEPHDGRTSRDH